MKTQMMIMAIVSAVVLAAVAILIVLILWMGWLGGISVGLGALFVVLALYFRVIKPWHLRWGTTDEEATMTMPGDDLIPDAAEATHAIAIDATPQDVWPWLVQIGYGRAGWYSYDWIDNDFKPSADRIVPEYQSLEVGDKILMMPTMGFVVESIDPGKSLVSLLEDGSTSWCLGLYSDGDGGTRLVSRWRPKFEMTPATVVMQALAEPGTFIMEQKMLRTIRNRVESASRN
jgi:hypothetical protein